MLDEFDYGSGRMRAKRLTHASLTVAVRLHAMVAKGCVMHGLLASGSHSLRIFKGRVPPLGALM